MPIVVGGIPSPIPFAPSLLSPANATYADLSGTPEFDWEYFAGAYGLTQSSWAFRRKIAGAGSYQYWNVSTSAWQSGLIFNSGADQDLVFPSASWTDGHIYNWSVATADANGTGPFAPDDTITAQLNPSVVINSPAGTAAQSQPVVSWTPTVPAGATQTSFRVVVYDAAEYGAGGFAPGLSDSVFDSGVTGSAFQTTLQITPALDDFTAYRVYVQITETGGQTSPWVFSAFTTSYAQPAAPSLTAVANADPDSTGTGVTLTVQGHDNVLTGADALTTPGPLSIGTWTATSGTTGLSGGSLEITGTTPGALTGAYSAIAGEQYALQALMAITGGGTAGSYTGYVKFYNGSGTLLSTVSSGAEATGTAAIWTATAPAGTATMRVGVTGTAGSSHTVLVSNVAAGPISGVGIYGGFAGLGLATVFFSDDSGQTWWQLRNGQVALPTPSQTATLTDNEAPPGFERQYMAVVTANGQASNSGSVNCLVTPSLRWWIKDPLDPSLNLAVSLQPGTLEADSNDRQQVYQIVGRPDPVVLSDAFEMPLLSLTLIFITDDSYQAFEALRATQHTFLLQGPAPAGQYYVRFGATKHDSTNLPSLRGFATSGHIVRTVTLQAQAIAAP